MTPDRPIFIHDTRRIISVNAAACALFRCEPIALIDRDMLDLLASDDASGLAALRLRSMREAGHIPRYQATFTFRRFDGSTFLAHVKTRPHDVVDQYETTVYYEDEK